MTPSNDLKSIFSEALARADGPERSEYLDGACAADPSLRAQVQELLDAHGRAGDFLATPPETPRDEAPRGPETTDEVDPDATTSSNTKSYAAIPSASGRAIDEGPGSRIGPYLLLSKLGEGGMGTVFLAAQEVPVRRKVALKVIKAGMDTAQVVARFEAERQALAILDHPNIARVYDAGATDSGRPFFVMEPVEGAPITRFADSARLSPRERLELFVPVCRAIQHAHQKGIIHRDIKPSNVLVTLVDGRPVPKVIDFGIAKATDRLGAEATMLTQDGAIVGTPEYMSPEQAGLGGLDIDTRTDVYSLGALLYELLVGTTPLDRASLRRTALEAILRRVREEEPPRPSLRLDDSGDALPGLSSSRSTEPARLRRLVRGDLDWIVMKALEKDRARRYETPEALAQDIGRHLQGDPVEAGPPSASYRLGKLARKYRGQLVGAALLAASLVLGTTISVWQAIRANVALGETRKAQALTTRALERSDREKERAEGVTDLLVTTLGRADPGRAGSEVKVVDVLDRLRDDLDGPTRVSPELRAALLDALGKVYEGLGLPAKSEPIFLELVADRRKTLGPDNPATLSAQVHLAVAQTMRGRWKDALPAIEEAADRIEARLGPRHHDTLRARNAQADALRASGRLEEAVALFAANLKNAEAGVDPDARIVTITRSNLASAYLQASRPGDAVPLLERGLLLSEARFGEGHADVIGIRNTLAVTYQGLGRSADAIRLHEANLRLLPAKFAPDHPLTLAVRANLAGAYSRSGQPERAIPLAKELLTIYEAKYGLDHERTTTQRVNLAVMNLAAGRPAEAVTLLEPTLPRVLAKNGGDHPDAVQVQFVLARAYELGGQFEKAEPIHRAFLRSLRQSKQAIKPDLALALGGLGQNLCGQKKYAEAEPFLRESISLDQRRDDDPNRFLGRMMLGEALEGQKKYAEAEPFLLEGYEGLKALEGRLPPHARARLIVASNTLARIYDALGQPEKAALWQARSR